VISRLERMLCKCLAITEGTVMGRKSPDSLESFFFGIKIVLDPSNC